ncbi:MAG: hypothetical protein HY714_00085 [Candidatus Omnitrophica bacterium]|nr:hypothetical protein [Candidatus Omnitrophota bacterium]
MDSKAEIIRPGSRVGQWHYPEGKFSFEKYVLLKETNLLGGADYDYYHSWQSEIKDVLLLQHPESGPWLKDNPHIRLVVHSSNQKFLAQTKYGDRVRVEAVTREIRFCSFIMSFRFYLSDGDTLLGTAWQKICAFNSKNDKLCRLPRLVLDLIEPLQEEGSPVPVSST